MNHSKQQFLPGFVPFLVLFFSLILFSSNGITAAASSDTDSTFNKYTYTLNKQTKVIDINGYTGNGENLVIPAKFVIDGVTFNTVLNGTCTITGVKKVSFERGVVIKGERNFIRSDFEEIDFTGVVNEMITSSQHFLSYNNSLTKITWGDFDIKGLASNRLKSIEYMCYKCPKLKELDLSSFDVSNMTYLCNMVDDCTDLESVNLSGLDFSNMRTDSSMLMAFGMNTCTNLKYVYAPVNVPAKAEYKLPGKFVDAEGNEYTKLPAGLTQSIMLYSVSNAPEVRAILNLPDDTEWQENYVYGLNRSYLTIQSYNGSVSDLHIPAKAVIDGDIYKTRLSNTSSFANTGKLSFEEGVLVTRTLSFNDSKFSTIDMTGLNMSSFTSEAGIFDGCTNLTKIILPAGFTCPGTITLPEVFTGSDGVQYNKLPAGMASELTLVRGTEYVAEEPEVIVQDTEWQKDFTYSLVNGETNSYIRLNKYKGSTVDSLVIPNTAIIDGKSYKVQINEYCSIIGVKRLSFERGVELIGFLSGSDFEEINLTGVNNMLHTFSRHMFSRNPKLKKIIWGDFNIRGQATAPIKQYEYTFYNCTGLTELDLSGYNMSDVTYLYGFFEGMDSLETLNLSSWNLGKLITTQSVPKDLKIDTLKSLKKIYVPMGLDADAHIKLPATFQDDKGNYYKELPAKLTKSILLTRVEEEEQNTRGRGQTTVQNSEPTVPDQSTAQTTPANDTTTEAPAKETTQKTPANNTTTETPAKDTTQTTPANDSTPEATTKDPQQTTPTQDSTPKQTTPTNTTSGSGNTATKKQDNTKVTINGFKYQIISKNTVKCLGTTKKNSTISVQPTVKIKGKTYKVTEVNKNAFKGHKYMKSFILGSNVTKLGANALLNAQKVKEIRIHGNKLSTIGSNCVKGIKKTARITIVCKNKKVYNNLVKKLKSAGAAKAKYVFQKG